MLFSSGILPLLLLLLSSQLLRKLLIPRPLPGIPYSRRASWMPWGDLISLGIHNVRTAEVFDWFSLQCLKHRSAVIQLFIPSFSTSSPVLIVADLQEIEDIVTRRMNEIDRASMMHSIFSLLVPNDTIGMKTDDTFKKQRRLWNSIISPGFLNEIAAPRFHEVFLNLVELWSRKTEAASGVAFEACEDLRHTTLEAVWTMAIGSNLGLLDAAITTLQTTRSNAVYISNDRATFRTPRFPRFYQAFNTLLVCLDWVAQGVSPRMYRWIFEHTSVLPKARHEANAIIQGFIDGVRTRFWDDEPIVRCGLDQVIRRDKLSPAPNGKAISDSALRDELMELLVTGHETTASALGWALKYLADNQTVQQELHAALVKAFPGTTRSSPPYAADIITAGIPFLDATIAEVLRISCTGPVSFREAIQDCTILGHRIPAGTPVILVTGGPSYSKRDALLVQESSRSKTSRSTGDHKGVRAWDAVAPVEKFVRKRWLDCAGRFNAEAGPSLPFSKGIRGCFGKRIAMLELRLMITMLILCFHFPRLPSSLSKYTSYDGLTRKPTCCYIAPTVR